MANKYLNLTGLTELVKQINSKYATKDTVSALSQVLVFRGVATSTDSLNTATAKVGDVYIADTSRGAFSVSGQTVESGDMIIAQAVTTSSPVSVTWAVVQANINGAVTTTSTALTSEHLIVGSNGRTIKSITPSTGYLYWNGTKHVYQTSSAYSLPLAASGVRGGIQIGYTDSVNNRKYGVKLENEKAYVTVNWKDVTITSNNVEITPTDSGNTKTFTLGRVTDAEYAHSYKTSADASATSMPFTTKFSNIDSSITDIEGRLDTIESQQGALPSFEAITNTEIQNLFK